MSGSRLSARSSSRPVERRALRALLYAGGLIATGAGLHTATAGGRSLPGRGLTAPSVESELRFYGTFYLAYGLVVLRTAPRADRDTGTVRAIAGTLFLAGLARLGGWREAGRPHRAQRALLAVELAAPPLVLAWQGRLAASWANAQA